MNLDPSKSSHTEMHRDKARDFAKRRRTYICLKGQALTLAVIGGIAAAALGLIGIGQIAFYLFIGEYTGAACIAGPFCFLVYLCGLFGHAALDDARFSPRVPPVAEQIAALPAEEVLVRGADVPAPVELLRAAHEHTAVPAEELLRAAQTATERHAEHLLTAERRT
jgi:hypothetical protein